LEPGDYLRKNSGEKRTERESIRAINPFWCAKGILIIIDFVSFSQAQGDGGEWGAGTGKVLEMVQEISEGCKEDIKRKS
jgi:hypothetical protein